MIWPKVDFVSCGLMLKSWHSEMCFAHFVECVLIPQSHVVRNLQNAEINWQKLFLESVRSNSILQKAIKLVSIFDFRLVFSLIIKYVQM